MTAGHKLGIGVVGAGRWAGLAHLPGWARDERCRIVGICDREPERAAAAADHYGAAVVTGDYRVLLDREDIDVIDVVTRDSEHYPVNLAAVEAGCTGSARSQWRTTTTTSAGSPNWPGPRG